MAAPLIIAVGSVLIRTTAKQLPKLLRRFKGAKEVKNPSGSQIDKAQTYTKNYTNFNKAQQKVLAKVDNANPPLLQRVFGTGRTKTQEAMKPDPALTTGEAKRQATQNKLKGGAGATGVIGGGTLLYNKLKPKDKPKPKKESPPSKGKTGRLKSKKPTGPKTVTVESGDTLTKIAKDKNISLSILKKLNPNIKDYNKIKPGQKIRIEGSK